MTARTQAVGEHFKLVRIRIFHIRNILRAAALSFLASLWITSCSIAPFSCFVRLGKARRMASLQSHRPPQSKLARLTADAARRAPPDDRNSDPTHYARRKPQIESLDQWVSGR